MVRRLFLTSTEHKDSFLPLRDLVTALIFLRKITLHQQPQNLFHYDLFFHGVIASSWPEPPYWRGFTITLCSTNLGVLGTSDQPVARPLPWQHTTFTRVRHPCHRRDSNLQSRIPTRPLALGFIYNIILHLLVLVWWRTWQCWWRGLLCKWDNKRKMYVVFRPPIHRRCGPRCTSDSLASFRLKIPPASTQQMTCFYPHTHRTPKELSPSGCPTETLCPFLRFLPQIH